MNDNKRSYILIYSFLMIHTIVCCRHQFLIIIITIFFGEDMNGSIAWAVVIGELEVLQLQHTYTVIPDLHKVIGSSHIFWHMQHSIPFSLSS